MTAIALGSLAIAGSAQAENEVAAIQSDFSPRSGSFFNDVNKPADWHFQASVTAPYPASPTVQPVKRLKLLFPGDAELQPDDAVTPVCPDSEVGPTANLSFPPDTVVARCPNSVLGNGTAGLYLAGSQSGSGTTLNDLEVVVFNGGLSAGKPLVKLYAYSQGTGVGLYAPGVWDAGFLTIDFPRYSFDSGVGNLTLDLPGTQHSVANRRGQNPGIVQAKCSTGTLLTDGEFTLGTRASDGSPTSPDTIINAPQASDACVGNVSQPKSLTVGKVGKGSGTVSSAPAGIDCGATCQAQFPETSEVTLTAAPSAGSVFAGWSGACTGISTCKVEMTEAKTVNAAFTPPPPARPVGISVNDGARYTNDQNVEISVGWLAGDSTITLSNDGGFTGGQVFDLEPKIGWTLDSSGPERLPKTVYARLGSGTQNLTDDIILDQTDPNLGSASATVGGGAQSSSVRTLASISKKKKKKSNKVIIKTRASDRTSGVGKIQVGPKKSKKLKKFRYKKKITVRTKSKVLWVRVFDRAGNSSKWKKTRVKQKKRVKKKRK